MDVHWPNKICSKCLNFSPVIWAQKWLCFLLCHVKANGSDKKQLRVIGLMLFPAACHDMHMIYWIDMLTISILLDRVDMEKYCSQEIHRFEAICNTNMKLYVQKHASKGLLWIDWALSCCLFRKELFPLMESSIPITFFSPSLFRLRYTTLNTWW